MRHVHGIALIATLLLFPPSPALPVTGDYLVVSWNDLGMHCMNRDFSRIGVLPPYNNLYAQVLHRGDAAALPHLETAGITVEYSVPGNTYSAGKVNFWTFAYGLFGVTLPPDIGLTGRGLSGPMILVSSHFIADGIPITPFPDAHPATEDPFQQARVIARDAGGTELARSTPVIPVSTEMGCVAARCHASETQILQEHPQVSGFNPAATPILCASCHADPALGTTGRPDAGYFSLRMHGAHSFLDSQFTGTALCYQCHPGPMTRCLRGVMASSWGLVCQDCHGGMANMASTIEGGRTPWLSEPACRTCHTSRFGEPAGQLMRMSTGHGGLYCEACHGSPHGEWMSREARDNANPIALQGHAGPLDDCSVCHRISPTQPGPHGLVRTDVAEREIMDGARPLVVYPNPARGACTIELRGDGAVDGRLLVYDAQGRVVALLRATPAAAGLRRASWDGRTGSGEPASAGVYFVRWQAGAESAAGRVMLIR